MESAYEENEEGTRLFSQGKYVEAIVCFERAWELGGPRTDIFVGNISNCYAALKQWPDAVFYAREAYRIAAGSNSARERLVSCLFGQAQDLHLGRKFHAARYCYAEAIALNPDCDRHCHAEIRKTVLPPALPNHSLVGFPDEFAERLEPFVATLLYFYQEIQAPVFIYWADETTITSFPLEVKNLPGIAHGFPHKDPSGNIISHNVVLNAAHYAEARPIEVAGDLAHELAHEAWKALGASNERFVPGFETNTLTMTSNEWIADISTIYRGFGPWLLLAREYASRRDETGAYSEHYEAMRPIELHRRLRVNLEGEGKQAIIQGAALVKAGDTGEAKKSFLRAKRIWQHVVDEDPAYAYGHYELAVSLDWLEDRNAAIVNALEAVASEQGNPRFSRFLQDLIDRTGLVAAKREDAIRLMKAGVATYSGNPVEAKEFFSQATDGWKAILEEVPFYAFAQHELGVAYFYLEDYQQALPPLRTAVQLNPTNGTFHKSLGDTYSQLGFLVDAVSSYRRAVQCAPRTAPYHYALGFTLCALGNLKDAERPLAEALRLDPGNEDYRRALGRCKPS